MLRALAGNAWVRQRETAVIAALGQENRGGRGHKQQNKTVAEAEPGVDRTHRQR
jgi:hypothetical protein